MPAAGEEGAGASPLLGLNTGAMAAFLVRKRRWTCPISPFWARMAPKNRKPI
ncbi:LPXTG cell wall anchor domain-containing protein [Methyloceanibacter superfactus]|uniref:LPXTG cell wall anchor domain-containing protein n=1 Tax=Methyloceanibacter superfactus TaxID=1774969 RepID=UPI001FCDA71F|nr:LPXTG cell wall anchor domain-containing protein [Methyloceanibacter superfactus]